MANHFRTDEQQESSYDDRFGVISQDDLNQLDQQDVAADQVETQDFSADVPVAQAAEPVTTVSDPFASGAEAVHVVTAEQQNNPEQAPLDRAKFFADLAQDAPKVERTGTPTISFKNASLVYPSQPNRPALDNISADIYPGEFVFVVGHSGSGKSSLLRLITREQKATHGQVIVAGQDLTRMRNSKVPYLRRQIGTVFQDFKLLPDKTVYENVSFALECIGKPRPVIDIQVPEVLRLVGLGQKMSAYPDQLSGGEQQRVSVARAMVNRPPLLICDEPTGNLDPAISLGIMKLLDRINRAGTTVVMATHDREMVDSMRKRVIALEAGHIVRDQEKGGYGYYGAL
ncbi:MAG: cell division ATP-binding protein FtsE [Atopobium sp.]|nr:cell division ATP-binding protein FtsE [Atopobium sp.]